MSRRVLVTGASSGIGAAAAERFAARGDIVGICARRADRLTEVAERCRNAGAASVHTWTVDLGDLDGIEPFARQVEHDMGGVDVLVNNAGVPKRRRTTGMSPDDVESVMAMNYFSPARLTLALLPAMVERGNGEVVNVSSMGVHLICFGVSAYAASKAALELFTEGLYAELAGTGVRAHLFVPGTTLTEFSTPKDGNDPPFPQDPATAATAEEVADALVACLDDDRFLTFATERDAQTAAAKNADPNAFVAAMRERLTAR